MPTRFTIVCDDGRAREIRRLARKFDLTEEEVLRQLVELGLENLDEEAPASR
ncbi:CopG family transcriptional regulator [Halobacteriales archaeon SW_7_65_23]|jgi:16S rRNA U516 pseudouridylate synthase RsuA-like enzyme|nr:MAG: CopG family transcriptional regulator [Halobacteriales archaeon SW_7_65_23]